MASIALVDATTFIGGYDWTTDLNQIALNISAAELECTTFGAGGYRQRIGGLKTVEAQYNGYWQSATSQAADPQAVTNLGTVDSVVTMTPAGAALDVAYMFQAGTFNYQPFGTIGEVAPFTLSMAGSNGVGLVRGRLNKAKGSVSSTGATGSGHQFGAVGATQFLYSTLHLMGTAGTTITVVVESDDNAGFSSATTRITFGPLTTVGGTWGTRVAGAITDDYYRFRVTAITGTWTVAGAIGIA